MGSSFLSSAQLRNMAGTAAYERLMVFTGNASPSLAEQVVRSLNIPLGRATVGRFSDGEVMV